MAVKNFVSQENFVGSKVESQSNPDLFANLDISL